MSWSVNARNSVPQVGADIERQFEQCGKCVEPEEANRQAARRFIAETVAAATPGTVLEVSAHGSQSKNWNTDAVTLSVGIRINPVS